MKLCPVHEAAAPPNMERAISPHAARMTGRRRHPKAAKALVPSTGRHSMLRASVVNKHLCECEGLVGRACCNLGASGPQVGQEGSQRCRRCVTEVAGVQGCAVLTPCCSSWSVASSETKFTRHVDERSRNADMFGKSHAGAFCWIWLTRSERAWFYLGLVSLSLAWWHRLASLSLA